ncbi:hypothetical protein TNCV_2615701 [Trichonephila clavipes]|nr:hypothetical protein TNCV_2615701 [Trichonephila clavipes]
MDPCIDIWKKSYSLTDHEISGAVRLLQAWNFWRDSPRGPRPTVPNLVYTTLGPEVHEQMFQSGGPSDAKPPLLSSQASVAKSPRVAEQCDVNIQSINQSISSRASLVLVYRLPEGMQG